MTVTIRQAGQVFNRMAYIAEEAATNLRAASDAFGSGMDAIQPSGIPHRNDLGEMLVERFADLAAAPPMQRAWEQTRATIAQSLAHLTSERGVASLGTQGTGTALDAVQQLRSVDAAMNSFETGGARASLGAIDLRLADAVKTLARGAERLRYEASVLSAVGELERNLVV